MPTSVVIKNDDFRLIAEFAQPDAKKRLSLGEALSGGTAYNIYRNTLGQLILDPVKAGLRESAEGKSVYRGSFAKHAKE